MRLEDDDRVVQFGLREVRYEKLDQPACPQLRDDLTPDGLLAVVGDRQRRAPVRPVKEGEQPPTQPFLDRSLLVARELAQARVARNHDPLGRGRRRGPRRLRADLLDPLDVSRVIELGERGIEADELRELA